MGLQLSLRSAILWDSILSHVDSREEVRMEDHENHFTLYAFDLHMLTWLEEVTSCGDHGLVRRVFGNLPPFLLGIILDP